MGRSFEKLFTAVLGVGLVLGFLLAIGFVRSCQEEKQKAIARKKAEAEVTAMIAKGRQEGEQRLRELAADTQRKGEQEDREWRAAVIADATGEAEWAKRQDAEDRIFTTYAQRVGKAVAQARKLKREAVEVTANDLVRRVGFTPLPSDFDVIVKVRDTDIHFDTKDPGAPQSAKIILDVQTTDKMRSDTTGDPITIHRYSETLTVTCTYAKGQWKIDGAESHVDTDEIVPEKKRTLVPSRAGEDTHFDEAAIKEIVEQFRFQ